MEKADQTASDAPKDLHSKDTMAKAEQVLILEPSNELHFSGPYDDLKTSYLKLTNPTDRFIIFKVKTTAPKTYCVRPNGGYLKPKQKLSVAVMLQPFDPENDDRSRDKFMVQSRYSPVDLDPNVSTSAFMDALWKDTPLEEVMNSKLKCTFDLPSGTTTQVTVDVVDQPKTKAKVVHVQEPKITDAEAEKKAHEEYKKLKAELNELRTENSCLKEEGLRSRVAYDTRTRGTSAKPFESESPHPPAKKQLTSNYFVLIAILVFLLGISIGKIVL